MTTSSARPVRAPRGTALACKGWPQEAAMRMLMNNLDPDVAEDPTAWWSTAGLAGPPAAGPASTPSSPRSRTSVTTRRCSCSPASRSASSGPPGRAARAHRQRVAGAGLGDVRELPRSRGARADDVRADDRGQLDLHRLAGHSAGHLRNARVCGRRYFADSLAGKVFVSAGLGGMGGASRLRPP